MRACLEQRRRVDRDLARIPHLVEPEVRRHAEQPGAGVLDWLVQTRERHERAHQGLLHEVVGLPGATRQVAAVAVQVRPQGLESLEKIAPWCRDRGRKAVNGGRWSLGVCHDPETRRGAERIAAAGAWQRRPVPDHPLHPREAAPGSPAPPSPPSAAQARARSRSPRWPAGPHGRPRPPDPCPVWCFD